MSRGVFIKEVSFFVTIILLSLDAFSGSFEGEEARLKAHAYYHCAEAREVIRVVDELGSPLSNAVVQCYYSIGERNDDYNLVQGVTDFRGEFAATSKCNNNMEYVVKLKGYYWSYGRLSYMETRSSPPIADGKWQPYGNTRNVVLRKIESLGRLKVLPKRRMHWIKVPVHDEWIGFDFDEMDYVRPHGSGMNSDVMIKCHYDQGANAVLGCRITMELSFTNSILAGAYIKKKQDDSHFKTDHRADASARYLENLSFVSEWRPGVKPKKDFIGTDSYLVYRVRTKVDSNGNLMSCHYGVVQGEFMSDGMMLRFGDSCFNPVPNDLSIEDGAILRRKVKDYGAEWSK